MHGLQSDLEASSFGAPAAEDERDLLEQYFVTSPLWRDLAKGSTDVVLGVKGTGKSALFELLLQSKDKFAEKGVWICPGENPRGQPVFKGLFEGESPTDQQLEAMWQLYFLTIAGDALRRYKVRNESGRFVVGVLERNDMIERDSDLRARLRRALAKTQSVRAHPEVTFDLESGNPTFKAKFEAAEQPEVPNTSVLSLLARCEDALTANSVQVWIIMDRLDAAFSGAPELERRVLRALVRTYNDFKDFPHIKLKLFLRYDVWNRLMDSGFREASHVSHRGLKWSRDRLVNLVARRLVSNEAICRRFAVPDEGILDSFEAQVRLIADAFPEGLSGDSFDWMLERCTDAKGFTAPREVIQFLEAARHAEIERLEIGKSAPSEQRIFSSASFEEAHLNVSTLRLEQTIYAENEKLRVYIENLSGLPKVLSVEAVVERWTSLGLADSEADCQGPLRSMVDVGVAARSESDNGEPLLVIPLLYQPALRMTDA